VLKGILCLYLFHHSFAANTYASGHINCRFKGPSGPQKYPVGRGLLTSDLLYNCTLSTPRDEQYSLYAFQLSVSKG